MRISKERLLSDAEATGFRTEMLEKAILLLHLLEVLFHHPFLIVSFGDFGALGHFCCGSSRLR